MGIIITKKNTHKQQKMSFLFDSMFNDFQPSYRREQPSYRRSTARCCNDPYCENNGAKYARQNKPQKRTFEDQFNTGFDSFYGNTFNRDPFFGGFNSGFFDDDTPKFNQTRNVKTAQPKVHRPKSSKRFSAFKENLNRSNMEEFDNKENVKPKDTNVPKFYSTVYQTNSVNNNGNRTTINKKSYKDNEKSETFVTKITEDKAGNQEVQKISPENYSDELKALMVEMEESGAVLMDISDHSSDREDVNSVKMLEENNRSNSFRPISQVSNTKYGNNLF